MEKQLKTGLSVRGDSIYCPLAFQLDSYFNCLTDCHHCWIRFMNHTWGEELRPLDVEHFERQMVNGLRNQNPKSPLARCLFMKKTLRWGNKSDPFQHAERKYLRAPSIFALLIKLRWTFVIQTMHTDVMLEYKKEIMEAHQHRLITIMPIITPGMDRDWEVLERKRTNPATERLRDASKLSRVGIPIGVNGEPFIPGYHKVSEFADMLKALKAAGINRYNTYNLHLNPFVAKRLHAIGLDIEQIWWKNQDAQWRPIQQRLCDLAKRYDIILGCPDFVNTGPHWKERANTCCGIDVHNPLVDNTHHWKRMIQEGKSFQDVLNTWEGVGDKKQAEMVIKGKTSKFYTLKDSGIYD